MDRSQFAGFTRFAFSHEGVTRDVYRAGTGPAVVIVHGLPGLYRSTVDFARQVLDVGCSVYLPSLFGSPGRPFGGAYLLRSMLHVCAAREFVVFARGRTSPVVSWLRALAAFAHDECGEQGVVSVGMSFGAGLALGMMVDHPVLAAVISQPVLPMTPTRRGRKAIDLSSEDLALIKARAAADGVSVMGLRFTHDRLVPASRFATLRRELNGAFISVEIDSSRGNPYGIPRRAHAVLTGHLGSVPDYPTRRALQDALMYINDRICHNGSILVAEGSLPPNDGHDTTN